jgi:hypothetical protein
MNDLQIQFEQLKQDEQRVSNGIVAVALRWLLLLAFPPIFALRVAKVSFDLRRALSQQAT